MSSLLPLPNALWFYALRIKNQNPTVISPFVLEDISDLHRASSVGVLWAAEHAIEGPPKGMRKETEICARYRTEI